jgi:hypothetical protein
LGSLFLLPNALSQLGPGVTWFDLDRDGNEDLLIGTGKGGRIAVFKNAGGHLVPQPPQGPVATSDFTTILGSPRMERRVSSPECRRGRRGRLPR